MRPRFPFPRLLCIGALLLSAGGAQAQSSYYRQPAAPPWKQLPRADVKVGEASSASAGGSALPNRAAFCKDVKGVLRSASKSFAPLKGAPQKSYTEDVSIWEAKRGVQDFRCSVYSTRVLGDYVYCVQSLGECKAMQDSFHVYSAYLMDSCFTDLSWQDSRVNSYDPRRMITATNDEGIRITLEMSRAKESYSKCDLTLSIELI